MSQRQGRLIVAAVCLGTFFATLSSVKYLSEIVAAQHSAAVRDPRALDFDSQVEWHSVTSRANGKLLHAQAKVTTHRNIPRPASSMQSDVAAANARSQQQPDTTAVGLHPTQMAIDSAVANMQKSKPATQPTQTALAIPQAIPQAVPKQSVQRKAAPAGVCKMLPHTDYWGDALVYGYTHKTDTPEQCCEACFNHKPATPEDSECNVWVHCGDEAKCKDEYKQCWLKHLAHPEASNPKTGPEVPWTSGLMGLTQSVSTDPPPAGGAERRYHIVISAQGSAVHWQARVHYYWYKKIRTQCISRWGEDCHMGGFTRLLHSGQPDELMTEIPTVVVEPLKDKDNKGYVVLNRPWAFVQWLQKAAIPEKYVLMSEPDHVWLRPMPNLMAGERPASFPFFYIEPAKKEHRPLTEKFTGPLTRAQAESIAPIGNAPTLLSVADLRRVAPVWMNVSHAIFDDGPAHEAWGWVLEMYGFTLACHNVGLPPASLHPKMMAQPPWDTKLDPFYILHYTYGMDYTLEGVFTPGKYGAWRFDKRSYAQKPPPRHLGEPPAGMPNELVRHLIHAINEVSDKIPGWDQYAETGVATRFWDGKL